MQNERNAESSQKNFLYYFRSALSNSLSLIITMRLFLMAIQDRFDCICIKPWNVFVLKLTRLFLCIC